MKVKIFFGKDHMLSKEINDWMEKVKGLYLIGKTEQTPCGDGIAITIWYQEML